MTVKNPALYLQASAHPAEDFRNQLASIYGDRAGVVGTASLVVSEKSGTPDMSVDVSDGSVLIAGTEATYQGAYLCHNRGTENVIISASDPTNSRYDLIVCQVEDSAYSGGTDAWKLAVVLGTPAATPLFPTVPDNTVVLATVLVAALASSIVDAVITDIRSSSDTDGTTTLVNRGFASGLGAPIICTSATRPTSGLFQGMIIFETNTDFGYIYDGSAWVQTSGVTQGVPTYALNWKDFGAGYEPVIIQKDSNGYVTMSGTFMNNTGSSKGPGSAVMNLPAWAHPANTVLLTCTSNGTTLIRMDVTTAGVMSVTVGTVVNAAYLPANMFSWHV